VGNVNKASIVEIKTAPAALSGYKLRLDAKATIFPARGTDAKTIIKP
jgi:hypothetical protein